MEKGPNAGSFVRACHGDLCGLLALLPVRAVCCYSVAGCTGADASTTCTVAGRAPRRASKGATASSARRLPTQSLSRRLRDRGAHLEGDTWREGVR